MKIAGIFLGGFLLAVSVGFDVWADSGGNGSVVLAEPSDNAEVELVKDLAFDRYTLDDTYDYNGKRRQFRWDSMKRWLAEFEAVQSRGVYWVTLQNYRNKKGVAPDAKGVGFSSDGVSTDRYGVGRKHAIPLYCGDDLEVPDRYARDGSLCEYLSDSAEYIKVYSHVYGGEWFVPKYYVMPLPVEVISKVIFVDRTDQNIATMERGDDGVWYVRSMNPATTGRDNPPYQEPTPLGVYVVQGVKPKMYYLHDGTSSVAGFAPWASRFTGGAYIHGVPLNTVEADEEDYVDFSPTLGTVPRSHMCVRNATSHARYIYDWAIPLETVVVVIE